MVGNSSFKNEVYPFVDSLRELHLSGSIIEFIWVNRKCNFVAHDLASHVRYFEHLAVWLEDRPSWMDSAIHFDLCYS